jgi:ABC-type Mn2+/Zn2+ transport system ATPase subunit
VSGDADILIDAENLALGYARRPILERVRLRVGAGEFWFLLGRNGAGKSTLLRAIVGTLPPLGGRLGLHPAIASRERLGFVPQRCDVNPALPTTDRSFVILSTLGLPLRRAYEA